MKPEVKEITKLIEEIEHKSKAESEAKKIADECIRERIAERKIKCENELVEISRQSRKRIKLFNQLCEQYKYADYRESNIILEHMKNLFKQ